MVLTIMISTLYFSVVIVRNRDTLEDEDFIDHYGVLYMEFKKSSTMATLYHTVFLLRRTVMIVTLVLLPLSVDVKSIVMMCANFAALMHVILFRPFIETKDNINAFISELAMTITSALLRLFINDINKQTTGDVIMIMLFSATVLIGTITFLYAFCELIS